ncbi:MAG: hypothetical protein JSV91_11630 [Phycisphaerales bacterium]|nr:MAG: hypothetical protein JSV91_11630 [Phycisphaerales bacterium]
MSQVAVIKRMLRLAIIAAAACGKVASAAGPSHQLAPEEALRPVGVDPSAILRNLPSAFDWRDFGACTAIRAQVCSDASWAFSAIGTVESAILIHHGVKTELSEQWVISCTDAGLYGAGSSALALDYMTMDGPQDPCGDGGAVLEWDCYFHCWPPPCDCPYRHPYYVESWSYVGPTIDGVPAVDELKQAILEHGPVSVRVHRTDAFDLYERGVFSECEDGPAEHSAVLVGWDDDQGAEGVWILRNSWGKGWGEGGYMRIEYGCSRVGYGACYVTGIIRDCNGNGVPDDQDIASHTSEDCNDNGVPDECDLADLEPGFSGAVSWSTFDPAAAGVGRHPIGFHGAVFDGRFVYLIPNQNPPGRHAEALRFDTTAGFDDPASWAAHDVGYDDMNNERGGYSGGVFDGRYVYFAPDRGSTGEHGEVLRLDTLADFEQDAAWISYDPGEHGVGDDPVGYNGAVFDGRYVYFVPDNNSSGPHGEVLRCDTTGDFADVSAWAAFDPGDYGVGHDPDGYRGGVFDGRYVYFVPHYSGALYDFEILRYDTAAEFADPSSWTTYDPNLEGMGGSNGAVFDGRYVYFAPISGFGERTSDVLRLDVTGDFSDPSAWSRFDPYEHGVGHNADTEYRGGVFDGRYVYFSPFAGDSAPFGEVLRYDTAGDFADASSWDAYDAGANAVGEDPDGYDGAAFDGRYVYFAPLSNDGGYHCEVLRYDTAPDRVPDCNENGILDECDIASGYSDDLNNNGIPDECEGRPVRAGRQATGAADIFAVLSAWGRCDDCPEDVNADGRVDAADLLAVLARRGPQHRSGDR